MLRLLLWVSLLVLHLSPATATHTGVGRCDSDGWPAAGIIEFTSADAQATFYMDDRNYLLGNGMWIYQESNGVWTPQGAGVHSGDTTDHNLQRGSVSDLPPDDNEICSDIGDFDYDTLIF